MCSVVAAVAGAVIPASASALVLTGLSVNGGQPVVAGSAAPVVCTAVPDGSFAKDYPTTANFSVPAGAVSPASTAFAGPDTSGSYTASTSWTAPATAGAYGVTCQGIGSRYPTTAAKTLTVSVTVTAPPVAAPKIVSFSPPPGEVLVSTPQPVSVASDDAAATYLWTATGGSFANPSAASTTWNAPAAAGTWVVKVTVTNAGGASADPSAAVNTVIANRQESLAASVRYPRRVAATAGGDLLVVDDLGALVLLTKRGEERGSLPSLGATAVAVGNVGGTEVAFVATRKSGILKFDPVTARPRGSIPFASSGGISGLAWDSSRQQLWVALFQGSRAVALRADGTQARAIWQAEGRDLRNLADVALDASTDTLLIAEKDGLTGNRLHLFKAADGSWVRSMVTAGSAAGQVADTGGIVLDGAGRVFVSDAFGGTVQVMSLQGESLGAVGSKGSTDGFLLHPRGLAIMANGDLAVANAWFNRLARYGSGADLPTCDGDSDCDGLSDAWEDANFGAAARNDAKNGLLDADGDGLNNLEEFALGTNPNVADTDADGYSDADEVAGGFDPLDPTDHKPLVVAGDQGEVAPGIVRLTVTTRNAENCTPQWKQLQGPSVALRDASTFAPSFIGRKGTTYRFQITAVCPKASSDPAVAKVAVTNVAPLADVGGIITTKRGHKVLLDARFSSDANGDALSYAWAQRLPVAASLGTGPSVTVSPSNEGYYEYTVTVADPAGKVTIQPLGVVVVDDDLPTAIVADSLLTAAVGDVVKLDATPSTPGLAKYSWRLVEPEGGVIATSQVAAFTVPAPGRYVFEVTQARNRVVSPPARVVVLAGEGGVLPTAAATAPATGAVNAEIALDGSASAAVSGSVTYAWRQVAGPAAGLAHADEPVATAVPFETGAYAFELTVTDGDGAVSAPAVVRFDVSTSAKPLPVAVASAPASAEVEESVRLDGTGSKGATRYRWTQIAGPWVQFDFDDESPHFRAERPGTYAFQLVVDDGKVQSAPVTVQTNVVETKEGH